MLVLAGLFVAASVALYRYVGLDFFPPVDAGLLPLPRARTRRGSRPSRRPERIVDGVEQDVRKVIGPERIEAIDDNIGVPVFYNLSFSSTARTPTSRGLRGGYRRSGSSENTTLPARMMDRIRRRVSGDFPGSTLYFESADVVSQVLNFGLPAPIDVQVQAREYKEALPFADSGWKRDLESDPGRDRRAHRSGARPALPRGERRSGARRRSSVSAKQDVGSRAACSRR